jgi:hypothetical protein
VSWFQDWLRGWKKSEETAEEMALTPVSEENEMLVLPIKGDELADGDDDEGCAPVSELTADSLPSGFIATIPVASVWQRKPPKKEVVRVQRVWWMSPVARSVNTRVNNDSGNGWTVRAVPVRGGRPVVADAQWFLDNYTEQPSGWQASHTVPED